jgi:DNA-binding transcriptional regulator YiaG
LRDIVNQWLQRYSTVGRIIFMELSNLSTVSRICLMTGDELKTFREKVGLSQDQLAKELKVARNTVSRWELEERKIPEFLYLALQTIERNLIKTEE